MVADVEVHVRGASHRAPEAGFLPVGPPRGCAGHVGKAVGVMLWGWLDKGEPSLPKKVDITLLIRRCQVVGQFHVPRLLLG
jgi:hypothetical protein